MALRIPNIRPWLICLATVALFFGGAFQPVRAEVSPTRSQRAQLDAAYPGLDSPDPAVRAQAVQAIRQAKDHAAAPALLDHIEDPDQRVGLYIAQGLVELARPQELTLLRVTLWNGNIDGRWRAAFVLGERRETRAIPALTRALRDSEVLVARTAADALSRIGSTAAINALADGLHSSRPSEALAARNGLLSLGNAAIPTLVRAMESGDAHVELSAALVLEAIGTPEARAALK